MSKRRTETVIKVYDDDTGSLLSETVQTTVTETPTETVPVGIGMYL